MASDGAGTIFGPRAYLEALTAFALDSLCEAGKAVDLTWLEDTFRQPFGKLDSEAAEVEQVHQVRLAIEVLRAVLGEHGSPAPYLERSYRKMLEAIGTSYRELRAARSADSAPREALAERLGVAAERLDGLFLVPRELSEAKLSEVFGLPDTTAAYPPPAAPSELSVWQREYLEATWLRADWKGVSGGERPLIDPDLIAKGELLEPKAGNPAFDLWSARGKQIGGKLAELRRLRQAAPSPAKALEAVVAAALPATLEELLAIWQQAEEGNDVGAGLAAYGLTLGGLELLAGAQAAVGDLLEGEWDELESVLAGAWKRLQFPEWRNAEKAAGIVLGPRWFRLPQPDPDVFPPPPPRQLPVWRADFGDLLAWRATLRGRIEQLALAATALKTTADETAAGVLPGLREELVTKLPQPGTPAEKAALFATAYQIGATVGGGQMTTRLGQAIETLQGILWGLRTGQLHGTHPTLELASEAEFDAQWQWQGSYGSWYAAALVSAYPENYLAPNLRRWRTPAFDDLVAQTRAQPQLTPAEARRIAAGYADYMRDVATLTVEAACTLKSASGEPGGGLHFMFGRGGSSGRAYWSSFDQASKGSRPQTPWTAIPDLGEVAEIVAAVPMDPSQAQSLITVVARIFIGGEMAFKIGRYDLDQERWLPSGTNVEVPPNAAEFETVLLQRPPDKQLASPPALVARTTGGEWYTATFDSGGTGLNADRWVPLSCGGLSSATALHAWVVYEEGKMQPQAFAIVEDAQYRLAVVGPSGTVTSIQGSYAGVLNFESGAAYLLYHPEGMPQKIYCILIGTTMPETGVELELELPAAGAATCVGATEQPSVVMDAWGSSGCHRAVVAIDGELLKATDDTRTGPCVPFAISITDQLSDAELSRHAHQVESVFAENKGATDSVLDYLRETFHFVPIQMGTQLASCDQYVASLDWMRTVYDYTKAGGAGWSSARVIAAPRPGPPAPAEDRLSPDRSPGQSDLEAFVLMSLVSCFLRYGDAEFGRDSAESVPRARTLYEDALWVLSQIDPEPAEAERPPNPVVASQRRHAELAMYKIDSGRNIAGMVRQLDPYAVAAETPAGMPSISGGQLLLPANGVSPPTEYRYPVLMEKAKQLAQLAGQVEATMLSALEHQDLERYNLLRARQDLGLANSSVQLQGLRIDEARDGLNLAGLGEQRAQVQLEHYRQQLQKGISEQERQSLELMDSSSVMQGLAAGFNFLAAALPSSISMGFPELGSVSYSPQGSAMAMGAGFSSLAGALSNQAAVVSTLASYERRAEEWQFQEALARQDVSTAAAQVTAAADQLRIAGQERAIGAMQASNAQANVEYLANKFTSAELFEWMSQVLEGVYRYFLQQATGVAQMAARQLAFERQEQAPQIIQSDYWRTPVASSAPAQTKGLTGSVRLLEDISRLEDYAFQTHQRKQQVTKTISLLRLAPIEFEQFRRTGVLRFATPMELFDRDFPGHYLRLLARVRVSVIALVPAAESIKATLSAAGSSRAVVSSEEAFPVVTIAQPPQSVALSSPREASGLFELHPALSGETLLPFEGMGVDTAWQLEMPQAANRFSFESIADVLLTLEYTALASDTYRSQVLRSLDSHLSADRPFSLRQEFVDQWWELCNPGRSQTPLEVQLETAATDFPPNLTELSVQQVTLYASRASGERHELTIEALEYAHDGGKPVGGGARTIDGVVSTRRGNGAGWLPIVGAPLGGSWRLKLQDTVEVRRLFEEGGVRDLLLVVTYNALAPRWPGEGSY